MDKQNFNFRKLFLIILSIFLTLFILPFISLFVFLPLYILRQFVIFLARYKTDLKHPLGIISCFNALDDIYSKPDCNIVLVLFVKGKINFGNLKYRISSVLESGKHPELTCYLTRWCSTFFWKRCPEFHLSNHVIEYNESDPEKVNEFTETLVTSPFKKGAPLWDVHLLADYENSSTQTQSALIVRIHHCLADAFSIVSCAGSWGDAGTVDFDAELDKLVQKLKDQYQPKGLGLILYFLEMLFFTPFETVYSYLKGMNDQNELTIQRPGHSEKLILYNLNLLIDVKRLKRISTKCGEKVATILAAGLTGALRAIILENHGGFVKNDANLIYSWPIPKHPKGMTNHTAMVPLTAPISLKTSVDRLAYISKELEHWKRSPLALGVISLLLGIGHVFAFTKKQPGKFGTANYSNFVYLGKPPVFFGHEASHINVLGGLQTKQTTGLFCQTVTYNGKMFMGVRARANNGIFKDKQDLKRLVDLWMEELDNIENYCQKK